jgi:hypothetical protein
LNGHDITRPGEIEAALPDRFDDKVVFIRRLAAQGVLPQLTPQASPVAVDLTPPGNQPAMIGRALHVLWKIEQGHLPQAVVVGLSSASESIQSALNAAGLGRLDVSARGVLALPLQALSAFELGRIGPKLPLR